MNLREICNLQLYNNRFDEFIFHLRISLMHYLLFLFVNIIIKDYWFEIDLMQSKRFKKNSAVI